MDRFLGVLGWAALAFALAACHSDDKDDGDTDTETGSDTGTDTDTAAPSSPCGEVPVEGVCVSEKTVRRCLVVTGQEPSIAEETCAAYETCATVDGEALCAVAEGYCAPGASSCVDGDNARFCSDEGLWEESPCPGCHPTPLGAACATGDEIAYTGTIGYEARGPNAELTDWSLETTPYPSVGLLVLSVRAVGEDYEIVDSAMTDDNGSFSVNGSATPTAGDKLLFLALHPTDDGERAAFGLFEPVAGDGEQDVEAAVLNSAGASPWLWEASLEEIEPSGFTLVVDEASGSGILRVFDYLRYAYGIVSEIAGEPEKSIVIWMRHNTAWNCGACFVDYPIDVSGIDFKTQMFIPATAEDQSYWADPVTVHELGHYVMAAWGTSPAEGGSHFIAVPVPPGMGWSEGFATGFSSILRGSSKYYDKSGGTFFAFDLEERVYPWAEWKRPVAEAGVMQTIDENEVAAMLWRLADAPAENGLLGSGYLIDALESERMNEPPFGRGYTTHTWEFDSSSPPNMIDIVDTGASAPMFADYLDALVCAGMDPGKVDAVTDPATAYPYPSGAPICD